MNTASTTVTQKGQIDQPSMGPSPNLDDDKSIHWEKATNQLINIYAHTYIRPRLVTPPLDINLPN